MRSTLLAAIAAVLSTSAPAAEAPPQSVQSLIEHLASSDIGVRREATFQLERLGPAAKEAVPALLKAV